MSDDSTPTAEQVRDAYVRAMRNAFITSAGEHQAEFDRWLAAHDAEVARRQAEHDATVVLDEIRAPRPHREITRSINDCDIIVNAALGKAAAAIRAANPITATPEDN